MGRPSAQIELVAESLSVGSIYVGGDAAEVGVHDAYGRVVDRRSVRCDTTTNGAEILRDLAEQLRALARDAGVIDRMVGAGATIKSGVSQGRILTARPTWRDVPAADILSEVLGLEVTVDRSQRALVTAESWFGAGAGSGVVAVLDVSDAVGAGISVDGRALEGFDSREGHLGHVVVPEGVRVCDSCGRPGCLQAQIRDAAFAEDAREVLDQPGTGGSGEVIDLLYQAARDGNRSAVRLVEARGRLVGHALGLLTAVVDPEVIVVSGPTIVRGWDLLEPVITTERLRSSPLPHLDRHSRVVPSPFGEEAVLVGTAALALRQFYVEPVYPDPRPRAVHAPLDRRPPRAVATVRAGR
ncbi:ROK family protein [Georgenia alba]|uniref:ROK family protein n=1 Tax=Georgenia alba TaxID=2233858 RepID=A0ABW2Q5K5_9MICO